MPADWSSELVCRLFWVYRHFETVLQFISDLLSEKERKQRETLDKRKHVQKPTPAPTASEVGPCPSTEELQWLEHVWDHENMFETRVVRAN